MHTFKKLINNTSQTIRIRHIIMNNLLKIIGEIDNSISLTYSKKNNIHNGQYIYTLLEYKKLMQEKLDEYKHQSNKDSKYQKDSKDSKDSKKRIICKKGDYVKAIDIYFQSKISSYYLPKIFEKIETFNSIEHIEQKSLEWLEERRQLIAASESGYLLGIKGFGTMLIYLCGKIGLPNNQDKLAYMESIQHGNIFEDVSRMIYESRNNVIVQEYGLIKSKKNPILGASPDGIVIKSLDASNLSRVGRLVEIKNPYKYDPSDEIKLEYQIQILQQQYVLDSPICDFVKTNIVGANVNSETLVQGFTPYQTLDQLLSDKYIQNSNFANLVNFPIQNANIPIENINSKGMEKGILISYKDVISGDIKVLIYPITIPYIKENIQEWIKKNKDELLKNGFNSQTIRIQYWYVAKYFEKTVIYDEDLFEKHYLPRLELIWQLVKYLRQIKDKYDNDIMRQFLETKMKTHLNKPSKFYMDINNFNEICVLLRDAVKLEPLLEIDSNPSTVEIKKQKIKQNKKAEIEIDF